MAASRHDRLRTPLWSRRPAGVRAASLPTAARACRFAAYIGSLDELGILKDNGGPTQTIAIILPSNDLIGHGLACVDWTLLPIGTDQRGHPRPPAVTERCDISAFEYNELLANGFE
jgi:hypothetical protein